MADPALAAEATRLLGDPRAREDPYPLLERLQAEAPVLRTASGAWLVTRHVDVRTVLTSDDFGVDLWAEGDRRFGDRPTDDHRYLMMSFRDPPEHTRMRRLVGRWFSARASERHRRLVAATVRSMLSARAGAGELDIVADLGHELPVNVTCGLLGIAPSDVPAVRSWTDCLARSLEIMGLAHDPRLLEEQRAFAGYVDRLMRGDAASHGALASLEDAHANRELTWPEVVAYVMLLLVAGRETVTNAVSTAVLTLLRHPEQAGRLRDEPELLGPAVEECLRYESPVRLVARIARRETALGGVELEPGAVVLTVLAAANRDAEAFAKPRTFDVGRRPHAHLAFGAGAHYCLGAMLGRLETEEVLRALFAGDSRIAPAADLDAPAWRDSLPFRGLARLPVTYGSG